MRKTERIDQVLIRLGHVTEADVDAAVARQRESGGRIGRNLVDLGALSEEQLFDGLVEQFRIPTISLDERSVPQDLLDRLPSEITSRSLVVPVAWNAELRVLSLAVANPSDEASIQEARRVFEARKVRVSLAPETVLADVLAKLRGQGGDRGAVGGDVRLIALPELFEPELAEPTTGPDGDERSEAIRRVVMVTDRPVRKNFLPAVFAAESTRLRVVSTAEETLDALRESPDALLVANEMTEVFEGWLAEGAIERPGVEVLHFSSLTQSLVDNPAPYAPMSATVRGAVQALAEHRCAAEGVSPPYALMTQDLEALAHGEGLGRLATDGLVIALHLLMPVERGARIEPFRAFANALETAHRLRFPWPVGRAMSTCLDLYVGRVSLDDAGSEADAVSVAAQWLALVWFRHVLAELDDMSAPEDAATELRSQLRGLAGRLATLDRVETYLSHLAAREENAQEGGGVVLMVGEGHAARALAPALGRVGCESREVIDLATAQNVVSEWRPDAILVDHRSAAGGVESWCRVLRVDRVPLFVWTDTDDPALVLNLLDIGVDDVFGPPHDADLVAARIHRALRSWATRAAPELPPGLLAARFDAMSFLDLAQMLANGRKSVRVDMRRGDEEATLYVRMGRPVHAVCGDLAGPAAVHRVVAWDDEGEFSMRDAHGFPEANLSESIESLLMEGVRLLDEGRARTPA